MQPNSSDQELIERIRRGDRQALELVYKANRSMIRRFVLQHQGTEQDADDLYQEVMLALHRNITTGKLTTLSGKMSTYLYKMARNQWNTQLRNRKWLASTEISEIDLTDEMSTSVAEDAFLQRMLSQLDDRCRRILSLFYFDGLSMQDVAEQVGLSNGESAKKRKYDCLAKLKKLAEPYQANDTE